MNSYNYSYNVLINRLEAFAAGHFLIRRFTHGQIDMSDQLQDDQYPFMHVTPDTIEPVLGGMNFGFHIMFADIPRDKEYKAEYQREVISDCIRLGQDLIAEVKNGLELFGFDVQLLETPTFEPFMEEQKNTVTGVAFTLKLSVPWDWSACDIPAIWSVGGASGTGGEGTGYGITLQTNGVDNVVQTLLNLVEGTNITITDNGNGSVTIDSTGGGATDFVSTAYNANHTTSTGNQYVVGDRVWYNGNVYQCIANNDAIIPTNTTYWTLVGAGYRLRQTPVDWNATSGDYQILNKPTITTPVNADWNASSGLAEILNKPTIPAGQVNSDWNASSGLAQILNKPTISNYDSNQGVYKDTTLANDTFQLGAPYGTGSAVKFLEERQVDIDAYTLYLEGIISGGFVTVIQNNSDGSALYLSSPQGYALDAVTTSGRAINATADDSGSFAIVASNKLGVGTYTYSRDDYALQAFTQNGIPGFFSVARLSASGTPLDIIQLRNLSAAVNGGATIVFNLNAIVAANLITRWTTLNDVSQYEIQTKPSGGSVATNFIVKGTGQIQFNKYGQTPAQFPDAAPVSAIGVDSVGNLVEFTPAGGGGTVNSVALSMPAPANPAFSVAGSPVTFSGTLAVSANGTVDQYVDGTGALRTLPSTGGGGGQIFYFNGNTSQGTIAGNSYYQLGTAAGSGAAANFTRATTGALARFITNVGSPNHLVLPSGVWTIDVYLSETGGGSNHAQIVAKLYIYDGISFTLIGTSPVEEITNGNVVDLYTFGISVPNTVTAASDRVHIEFDIQNTNGKTVTLYTEDSRIGEVHTTYAIGISSLNGLTESTQNFAVGTAGTDFAISSAAATHTFNLPTASATNRGALSSANWSTFNGKQDALVSGTNIKTINSTSLLGSGNISVGSTTLLYQSQNATNIPAASIYFGCLFGGALSIVSADTLRRTPIASAGTLTKLYVQTSTAQPGTGSLVCTVRKNSVDQALTLTIAAGSAAGVFTDLVNSVSVVAGDLLGMKFQNNAPAAVSANVLSNQVILSI